MSIVQQARATLSGVPSEQVFVVFAILVGLLVSYYPPVQNGAAIYGMVGMFLGHLITRMFPAKDVKTDAVASDPTTTTGAAAES